MAARVPRIARGGVISFRYLHDLEDAVIEAHRTPRRGAPEVVERRSLNNADQSSARADQLFDGRAERAGAAVTPVVDQWVEVSRTSDTVRVENPEDAEQYVDVARVATVTLEGPNGERMRLTFDNT